jgi:RimJ/RimL family protein N-acetyltransferase
VSEAGDADARDGGVDLLGWQACSCPHRGRLGGRLTTCWTVERGATDVSEDSNASDEVYLRIVEDRDLDVFFEHQADPVAAEMAAFRARDRDRFAVHWARMRADDTVVLRTIVARGMVAGNIVSWHENGRHLIGYWVGREYWGRGVARQALARFVDEVSTRPLYAYVAVHNVGSIRVLENCGFQRDRALEAQAPVPDDGIEEFIFVLNV